MGETSLRVGRNIMSLALLPLAFLGSVSAHGGVLWPPIWQAGVATPIEEFTSDEVFSEPKVVDPNSGRIVKNVKSWLTDQAYTEGVGHEREQLSEVQEPLGSPWTSPQPWWRLWSLRRKPLGVPSQRGRQAPRFGMRSGETYWTWHEGNIVLRDRR